MIRPNTPHPIVFDAVDFDNDPLAGVTDLLLTIVDADTDSATFGHVWDWSTDAFTATPVEATIELDEVNATYVAGKYAMTWPGAATGTYAYTITQSPGVTVANVPATEVLQVRVDAAPGDQMALTSGERTIVQALVLSDATPFQGARIDAAVSSRSSHAAADIWAVGTRVLTGIGSSGIASQTTVDALPTAAGIADAVLDEALSGHVTAGTLGAAVALVDVAVSSRATNAGVWATAESSAAGTNGYAVSLMRKWITNQHYVDTTSSGRMRLFDDDASTVLLTWTLRDRDGNAITTPAGSPAQRGEAA
jgi:hypothetical protein